ncbi:MAG: hypothetical protein QXQ46_06265 [Thermoplasmatales archaeon]
MGKIFRNLVTFEEARSLAMEHATPMSDTELIPVAESLGRISAADVFSKISLLPFTRSEVDGYAVVLKNLETALPDHPVELSLTGRIDIGEPSTVCLASGQCLYIAIGTVIPPTAIPWKW